VDEAFEKFVNQTLALPKYDLQEGFRASLEESLKMTTMQRMREALPWVKKDPQRAELEGQIRIVDNMTPLQRLFPLQIGLEGRQKLALSAGTTASEVSKLVRHFMQARAMHDFIHARKRWDKRLPNDTEDMMEMMRVRPSSRGYMLMVELSQKRHAKKRRFINYQRPHFKRGH
jgi:signal recognition particle GTPase